MPRHDYMNEKKPVPDFGKYTWVECPECEGYGGWIINRDAYGPGRHFEAHCAQCSGWGWVVEGSVNHKCIHEWRHTRNLGNCYNEYECTKCGSKKKVDSGD